MADAQRIGRGVYAQTAKERNPEGVATEMLEGLDLDEFDRIGLSSMLGVAWGVALAEDPFISEEELVKVSTEAARMAFRAGYTVGGFEAMEKGVSPEKAVI